MRKITWKAANPGAAYSAHKGTDQEGNTFYETANREVITCVLTDGTEAMGWTVEEAYNKAIEERRSMFNPS